MLVADTSGDEARFRMLESLRQYGVERLARARRVRRRRRRPRAVVHRPGRDRRRSDPRTRSAPRAGPPRRRTRQPAGGACSLVGRRSRARTATHRRPALPVVRSGPPTGGETLGRSLPRSRPRPAGTRARPRPRRGRSDARGEWVDRCAGRDGERAGARPGASTPRHRARCSGRRRRPRGPLQVDARLRVDPQRGVPHPRGCEGGSRPRRRRPWTRSIEPANTSSRPSCVPSRRSGTSSRGTPRRLRLPSRRPGTSPLGAETCWTAASVEWVDGMLLDAAGDARGAYRHLERSLRLHDELGMGHVVVAQARSLALLAGRRGESELAAQWRTFVERRTGRSSGGDYDGSVLAAISNQLGLDARRSGDHERARTAHLEARAWYSQIGVTSGSAFTESCLGFLAGERGDRAAAADHHANALDDAETPRRLGGAGLGVRRRRGIVRRRRRSVGGGSPRSRRRPPPRHGSRLREPSGRCRCHRAPGPRRARRCVVQRGNAAAGPAGVAPRRSPPCEPVELRDDPPQMRPSAAGNQTMSTSPGNSSRCTRRRSVAWATSPRRAARMISWCWRSPLVSIAPSATVAKG